MFFLIGLAMLGVGGGFMASLGLVSQSQKDEIERIQYEARKKYLEDDVGYKPTCDKDYDRYFTTDKDGNSTNENKIILYPYEYCRINQTDGRNPQPLSKIDKSYDNLEDVHYNDQTDSLVIPPHYGSVELREHTNTNSPGSVRRYGKNNRVIQNVADDIGIKRLGEDGLSVNQTSSVYMNNVDYGDKLYDGKHLELNNWNFPGNDLLSQGNVNYNDCNNACEAEPSCRGTTFIEYAGGNKLGLCYLKSNMKNGVIDYAVTSTIKNVDEHTTPENTIRLPHPDIRLTNKYYPNATFYGETPMDNEEACILKCAEDELCQASLFDKTNENGSGLCKLQKNIRGEPIHSNLGNTTFRRKGIKIANWEKCNTSDLTKRCDKLNILEGDGWDYPGGDIVSAPMNMTGNADNDHKFNKLQCANWCDNTPECRAAVYVKDTKKCFLKDASIQNTFTRRNDGTYVYNKGKNNKQPLTTEDIATDCCLDYNVGERCGLYRKSEDITSNVRGEKLKKDYTVIDPKTGNSTDLRTLSCRSKLMSKCTVLGENSIMDVNQKVASGKKPTKGDYACNKWCKDYPQQCDKVKMEFCIMNPKHTLCSCINHQIDEKGLLFKQWQDSSITGNIGGGPSFWEDYKFNGQYGDPKWLKYKETLKLAKNYPPSCFVEGCSHRLDLNDGLIPSQIQREKESVSCPATIFVDNSITQTGNNNIFGSINQVANVSADFSTTYSYDPSKLGTDIGTPPKKGAYFYKTPNSIPIVGTTTDKPNEPNISPTGGPRPLDPKDPNLPVSQPPKQTQPTTKPTPQTQTPTTQTPTPTTQTPTPTTQTKPAEQSVDGDKLFGYDKKTMLLFILLIFVILVVVISLSMGGGSRYSNFTNKYQ